MVEGAIVVRGLRKRFGAQEAVAGIDLDVAAGSCAGLVGPNGAGKTTSLSMMTGLLRPDGGQVLINGLDVWSDPCAAKAAIGVVPAGAGCSTGSAAWNCWNTRAGCAACPPPRPASGLGNCSACLT